MEFDTIQSFFTRMFAIGMFLGYASRFIWSRQKQK